MGTNRRLSKPKMAHTEECRRLTAWFDAGYLDRRWLCTGNCYCSDSPCRCLDMRAKRQAAHAACEASLQRRLVDRAAIYPGDGKSRAGGAS